MRCCWTASVTPWPPPRADGVVAVLFVDLDHFKQVNDTVGHEGGDQLLVAVAARLRETMRPGDTVARLSGDEFIVVCEDVDTPEAARTLADRITEKLSLPFTVEGTAVYVGASVGVAVAGPVDDARKPAARRRPGHVPRQAAGPRAQRDVRRAPP